MSSFGWGVLVKEEECNRSKPYPLVNWVQNVNPNPEFRPPGWGRQVGWFNRLFYFYGLGTFNEKALQIKGFDL